MHSDMLTTELTHSRSSSFQGERQTDRQTAEEEKEGKNRRGSEVKLGEGGSITIPQKPLSLAPAPGLPSTSTRFLSLPLSLAESPNEQRPISTFA